MSFVLAAPAVLAAAAPALAPLGSSLRAARAAAAGPPLGLLAAGAAAVSVALSALFGSPAPGSPPLRAPLAASPP
ncbi:PE family protein, partial [Mycobacterium tuberculosis]|uniref:PE domain-containing protein n=1 Tax=Mycobacterium tuberculosis TaxID=1773 RepID=UPI000E26E567